MARIRFISACQRTVPTTSPPTPAPGQRQAEHPECRTEQQAGERPDPGDQQVQPRGGELLAGRDTPPNNQKVVSSTSTPAARRAAMAWLSSCAAREPRNSPAPASPANQKVPRL
jgi:hypothetical protein